MVFYDGVDVRLDGLRVTDRLPTPDGAVVVRNAENLEVVDLQVTSMRAPAGQSMAIQWRDEPYEPLPGAPLVGLRVEGVAAVTLSDVVLHDLTGGRGGASVSADFVAPGGPATGVHVSGATTLDITGLEVRRLVAGAGSSDEAPPGRAAGLWVADTARAFVNNVLAVGLEGDGTDAAVWLAEGAPLVRLAHLTAAGSSGAGVAVAPMVIGAIEVRDSLFSLLEGPAVANAEGNDDVALAWSGLDRLGAATERVAFGEGVLDGPRCFDPFEDSYALLPGSVCVDAGTDGADCGDEPLSEDGSCRLDLGHLGGTADAQAL